MDRRDALRVWIVLAPAAGFACAAGCGLTSGEVLQAVDAGQDATAADVAPMDVTSEVPSEAPSEANDGGCGDSSLASDPKNCGACGHDCLGGACVVGMCQPILLASGPQPFSVVVDDTRVYWSTAGTNPGDVRSVGKDGSDPQTLASGLNMPQGVFVDEASAFWTELGVPGRIWQGNKDGSNAIVLYESGNDGPQGIVADKDSAYWIDIYLYYGVLKAARGTAWDGGAPQVLSSPWDYVYGIAQDSTTIYWTSEGSVLCGCDAGVPGKILSIPKDGSRDASVLADGLQLPRFVAVDTAAVYWTDSVEGSVRRLGTGQSASVVLAQAPEAYGIAVDAAYAYFTTLGTDHADGTLQRVPKDGSGPAVVLATGLSWPSQIAVDDRALYWGNSHGGTVLKLAK